MLCPNCLQNVSQFEETRQLNNSLTLSCPQCHETVPLRYAQDYERYPPIVFSVVGLFGHGKTVFFSSLLIEFELLAKLHRAFSYTPLDEAGLRTVRETQRLLEQGVLPSKTPPNLFPKPVILQVEGMGDARDFRLLVYDIGGEVFENVSQLKQFGGYVSRGRTTVWLVSLPVLEKLNRSPRDLADFVTRYVQAVAELGGKSKDQVLLIVLTMGDLLLGRSDLPEAMREFLQGKRPSVEGSRFGFLEEMSGEIEHWLEDQPGYQNFVRRVRKEFAEVKYCTISALGSQPQGGNQLVSVVPRGVLVPLQWVLHFERDREQLQDSVLGLEADLARRKALIDAYLGKATYTRLESQLSGAKETVEGGSIEQARERVRAVKSGLLQSARRAQLLRAGRYLAVILVGSMIMAGLGWLGWQQWLKKQRKESWYIREHIEQMMAEGGVIQIPPGEYQLSRLVVLHKPLSLQGGGKDSTRIICKEGSSGLSFAGDGVFAAADITFEYAGSRPANVLTIESGQIDFQRCRFTGGIRHQTQRNAGNGVQLRGHAAGTISECEFVRNQQHGLSIDEQAQPALTGNLMKQNQGSGIAYFGYSAGTAHNTNCYENQIDGIQVNEQARPVLEDGVCSGNQRSGISFSGKSAGTARNNQCINNRLNGIRVDGQAQPTLEKNTCEGGTGSGIGYFDSASGTASQNQCLTNAVSGIVVNKRAQPVLEGNVCRDNAQSGIAYLDGAAGVATKNECSNNKMNGISVQGQAQPTLEENTCKGNQNCGIRYIGSATGTARNNKVVNNRSDGILVRDHSHPVLENNLSEGNEGSGIAYSGSAAGIARNNRCLGNGVNGLSVADQAQPIVEDNVCSDNKSADLVDWRDTQPEEDPPQERQPLFMPTTTKRILSEADKAVEEGQHPLHRQIKKAGGKN